jgi:hypothetical protein
VTAILSILAAGRRLKPEATSPFDISTMVSYQCKTHYMPNRNHLKVMLIFSIVEYGGMSVSTASGRLGSDITSW